MMIIFEAVPVSSPLEPELFEYVNERMICVELWIGCVDWIPGPVDVDSNTPGVRG